MTSNRPTHSSTASRAVDKDDKPRTSTSHALGLDGLGRVVTGTSGILNRSLEEEIVFQGEESSQESAEAIRWQALFNADKDEPEDSGPADGEDPEEKWDPADGEDPEGNTLGNNDNTGIMATDVTNLDEHLVKLLTVTKLA